MISKNILRRIFEGAGDAVGGVIFKTPPHTFFIFGKFTGLVRHRLSSNKQHTESKDMITNKTAKAVHDSCKNR